MFRTQQEFIEQKNPVYGKGYLIALDAGYSGMKVFTENKVFCFPSFVKKIGSNTLNIVQDKDILYEDYETGERYMLGFLAQDMVASDSTNDTEEELFARKRYNNKKFQILCNAAIAIAVLEKTDDREIVIQTGLPTDYLDSKADRNGLKKAICKPANFGIKLGKNDWISFEINGDGENGVKLSIKEENIYIMSQPAGSLYSVMVNNMGTMISDLVTQNTLIMDIGFGTFDFYGISSGEVICKASIDNIGMKQILKNLSGLIMEEYNEDVRIPAMQRILEKGTIVCIDEDNMKSVDKPIAALLERASRKTFEDAFEVARNTTHSFRDYRNIIIAGGTGKAWYEYFVEKLKGMQSLRIMPCNTNSNVSFIYANVRGYYMRRYRTGLAK